MTICTGRASIAITTVTSSRASFVRGRDTAWASSKELMDGTRRESGLMINFRFDLSECFWRNNQKLPVGSLLGL
jgi:hypothetical protein